MICSIEHALFLDAIASLDLGYGSQSVSQSIRMIKSIFHLYLTIVRFYRIY